MNETKIGSPEHPVSVYTQGLALIHRAESIHDGATSSFYWNVGEELWRAVIADSRVLSAAPAAPLWRSPSVTTQDGHFTFCGLPAFVVDRGDTMRLMMSREIEVAKASLREARLCQKPK